jgi:hypothetical protein
MKDSRRRFLKRTAIAGIALGTYPSQVRAAEVAARVGQAADAAKQRRLAISFWNFGLLSTGPNSIFNALEMRMAETVERGFNCIRTEGGAGITMTTRRRTRPPSTSTASGCFMKRRWTTSARGIRAFSLPWTP